MRKVVGLDLSLTATGTAVALNGQPIILETLKPKTREDLPRLWWIYQRIREFAPADLFVLEGFAFNRGNQAHQIGGLQYLVRIWLWKAQIPFLLVAPTTLKKFATGKGNAEKEIVVREVFRRWDIDARDNNQADAAALAMLGLTLIDPHPADNLTQKQLEALETVRQSNAAALDGFQKN